MYEKTLKFIRRSMTFGDFIRSHPVIFIRFKILLGWKNNFIWRQMSPRPLQLQN